MISCDIEQMNPAGKGAGEDFKAPDAAAFDAGGVPPPTDLSAIGGDVASASELVSLRKRVHELQGKCTFLTSQFEYACRAVQWWLLVSAAGGLISCRIVC